MRERMTLAAWARKVSHSSGCENVSSTQSNKFQCWYTFHSALLSDTAVYFLQEFGKRFGVRNTHNHPHEVDLESCKSVVFSMLSRHLQTFAHFLSVSSNANMALMHITIKAQTQKHIVHWTHLLRAFPCHGCGALFVLSRNRTGIPVEGTRVLILE